MHKLSWIFLSLGIVLGISITFVLVYWLGRSFFKRLDLQGRGWWDRPLAEPLPKDKVVAIYKRRKRYHRHHRDYHQHRRPHPD